MTESTPTTETFHTSDVEANQAIENGQGVGARELNAQREAGEAERQMEQDSSEDVEIGGDADTLDRNVAIQGADDEEQLDSNSDA